MILFVVGFGVLTLLLGALEEKQAYKDARLISNISLECLGNDWLTEVV